MDREDSSIKAPMLPLPLLAAVALSQGIVARFDAPPPPDLTVGQKIKVRFLEVVESRPFGIVQPRLRAATVVGTLTLYRPEEGVVVRRHGWAFGVGPESERTLEWMQIRMIEVPQRRNALNAVHGAAGGFGAALGWGLMAGIFDSFFCTRGAQCDRDAWDRAKEVLPVALPIGIIVGFFSTRWKRVY